MFGKPRCDRGDGPSPAGGRRREHTPIIAAAFKARGLPAARAAGLCSAAGSPGGRCVANTAMA